MKNNLLFDFTVNKQNNTVNVKREFAANLELVWDAWTKPEILDQWWAPKPYRTETKLLDFREGGMWLYAMISPENEAHWCKNDYRKIEHHKSFTGLDAFCDENGKVNEELPRTLWTNTFTENAGVTLVTIVAKYDSLADLEKVIELGFKEGFTMALGNLDEYIEAQSKLRLENETSSINNMTHTKIMVDATIIAGTKKVWEYYNQPEHITKWNFAIDSWQCPKAENDLRVGGKYFARMEAKDGSFGFDLEAIYDEVTINEKMVYTMVDGRKVTIVFENRDNKTQVTITFDAESENPIEMQKAGWQAILNNFKKYVESN